PARVDELTVQGRPYEIVIIGLRGKKFTASSGLTFTAHCDLDFAPPLDTLIVPGGSGLREPGVGEEAARWIARRASRRRRSGSGGGGGDGFAPGGLRDGRRVTTHWSAVRDVQRRFPKLRVEGDAVYLKDGSFYSSAGITAGIDLVLALIEEDCGPNTALAVA